MARTWRGALAAIAVGTVAGALAFAGSASAHVTVGSSDATQGGFGRIAFRVPNESDTATTTKLEVHLPDDQPVASVSVMPLPGWTAAVQNRHLDKPIKTDDGDQVSDVVSVVTWTASPDAALKSGQFQEFPVSLGPLPKTDKLVFKVLQYYSDGSVVRWIDLPEAGGKEPDHPAPILTLAAGTGDSGSADSTPSASPAAASKGGDGAAVGLGVAGLVAGLAGLVLGGLAFLRTRRTT